VDGGVVGVPGGVRERGEVRAKGRRPRERRADDFLRGIHVSRGGGCNAVSRGHGAADSGEFVRNDLLMIEVNTRVLL
jgi:hypothetical protein